MQLNNILFTVFVLLFLNKQVSAQDSFNLLKLYDEKKLKIINREVVLTDKNLQSVKLSESGGEGLAWLEGVEFKIGVIEIDLKGKDELQKSFLGVAFHGLNDSTYDAIYFRPFNFHAKDSVRRIHAVQYISHPEFPWKKLRDEKNALYEKEVFPKPDPNNWFHARIEIGDEVVKVFINNSTTASLEVKKLNSRNAGKIGLWVGDGAGGEFSKLKIAKKK